MSIFSCGYVLQGASTAEYFDIQLFRRNNIFSTKVLFKLYQILNPANVSFCTPWKQEKTKGFLLFSEGLKLGHWPQMSL